MSSSEITRYLASALRGSAAHVAKVSQLGAAVSNGQYHGDMQAVIGSLIQHSIEFGAANYWTVIGAEANDQ